MTGENLFIIINCKDQNANRLSNETLNFIEARNK
jgi:hypothetical protein